MSSSLTLRNLKWSDYANARALLVERFCHEDVQFFVQIWPSRNKIASVCWEWMGCIVGFLLVTDFQIQYLVVHELWEGKGLGKSLLSKAIGVLKEQGFRSAQLTTADREGLRTWYSKQGFEYSSTFCDSAGICGDRMILRFRVLRGA